MKWCHGKVCLLQAAQSQLAQQARAHSLEQVQLAEKASAQSAEVTHTAAELQGAKSALNAAQAQTAQLQVFLFLNLGASCSGAMMHNQVHANGLLLWYLDSMGV